MRVCIVASGDFFSNYGGGQVYVRNIVDAFIQEQNHLNVGLSVLSIAQHFYNNYVAKDYNGIQIYEINPDGNIEQLMKFISPDIVHINGHKLLLATTCKKLNIPAIVTAHHGGLVCPAGALMNTKDEICHIPADYDKCLKCYLRNIKTGIFWYPILKKYSQKHFIKIGDHLKRMPFIPFISPIGEAGLIVSQKLKEWQELCENSTHFIAPSHAMADALKCNGCPPDKITVIPHGIPIHSTTNHIRPTYNIKFYFVGRINYIKGIHILLKAFSSINNPKIELHIIGGAVNNSEQHYQNKLKRKYRKDARIIWHGKISPEQMQNIIKEFQCLVHPTICLEVFGLDIAEALAQNKYVIATKCGGAEMQITKKSTGWLVKPNDVEDMRNALIHYCIEKPQPYDNSYKPIDIASHIESLLTLYKKCKK